MSRVPHPLDGNHYVSVLQGRHLRSYVVKRGTTVFTDGRRGITGVSLRYVEVSRHFTWKAAAKRAHQLNREAGRSTP